MADVTILARLTLTPRGLGLLDHMAASAGKSRDQFLSDWVAELVRIETTIHERGAARG